MSLFFKKTLQLETQIDEYLDLVIKGGLVFRQGIKCYLDHQTEEFENYLKDLRRIEEQADDLRRNVEIILYTRTLIPEARGDVLGLMESCDKALNITAETLLELSVEIPNIPLTHRQDFLDLSESSIACLENTVSGIRSYFKNIDAVRDYVTKVQFYKKETNKIAEKIKRLAFRADDELSQKIHIRYVTFHIERIAEQSEDICDRLAISSIKRFE